MLSQLNQSLEHIIAQTEQHWPLLLKITAISWGIFLLNVLLGKRLLYLGIIPRHWIGLPGIVFAPLLHANFDHLFFNTIPFLILGNFILMQGIEYFIFVTGFITIVSGFLIWCFAKSGIHVGASALITGYWGVLVMNSYYQWTLTAIILGFICIYYFAGIFFGIFPRERGVSWEGHLFGLIAGIGLGMLPNQADYSNCI